MRRPGEERRELSSCIVALDFLVVWCFVSQDNLYCKPAIVYTRRPYHFGVIAHAYKSKFRDMPLS